MARRGMGAGQGKGFKNILPMADSRTHSNSARGIKQPQKMPESLRIAETRQPETKPKTDAEQELIEAFDSTTLKEIRAELNIDEITSFSEDEDGVYSFETDSGEEYRLFIDEERAERMAEEQVREDLENEPEMFTQDWLQNFVTMSDTDRRIISQEESDNIVDNMDDDDIIKEADKESEWELLNDQIEVNENKFIDGLSNKSEQKVQNKIDKLEEEKEELLEKSKEDLRGVKYDEIYEALDDPINYFVEEQGIYSKEELLKQSFISIDIDEATESAISTDGWQHFISRYDGNSIELPSGAVLVREN